EPRERLVEHQQVGLAQQRQRELHALLVAAREALHGVTRTLREAEALEPPVRGPRGRGDVQAGEPCVVGQVVPHGHPRVHASLRRHVPEPQARRVVDGRPVPGDHPLVERDELHDRPHRGGLPGAVRTEEADELTRSHLERHTVEGDDRAEALRDAADLQHDEPTLTAHTHGPRGAGQVRSWRMRTRGNPSSTESVSATFTKPSCSNRARVPTYAIVRSTFSPPLSTGYPSSAGAPESRAKSI